MRAHGIRAHAHPWDQDAMAWDWAEVVGHTDGARPATYLVLGAPGAGLAPGG